MGTMCLNSRLTRWVWRAWRKSLSPWMKNRIGNAMTCVGWPNSNSRKLNLWVSVGEYRNIQEEHCEARTSGSKAEGEVPKIENTLIWIIMNSLFIIHWCFLCFHFYRPLAIHCMWDWVKKWRCLYFGSFEVIIWKYHMGNWKISLFYRKGIGKI